MPTPAELADTYLQQSFDLRAAVAGMTREQLLARPVPGKWSTLEVLAHIADFEPVFADRILRVIALRDTPLLLAADENQFIEAMDYQARDIDEELAVVDAIRRKTARVIRGLSPEQLGRTGVHSQKGLMTLEKVIAMACYHIPHHLPFIAEKRAALG